MAGRNEILRGNRLPFGDQESVAGDTERGVMVEAAPTPPFEVVKTSLLLELLVVAFDAPAQFGKINEMDKADVGREARQPVLCRLLLTFRPLDEKPFFRPRLAAIEVAPRNANAHSCKAGFERLVRSLAPSDRPQALAGRLKARSLTLIGWCFASQRRCLVGGPRPGT